MGKPERWGNQRDGETREMGKPESWGNPRVGGAREEEPGSLRKPRSRGEPCLLKLEPLKVHPTVSPPKPGGVSRLNTPALTGGKKPTAKIPHDSSTESDTAIFGLSLRFHTNLTRTLCCLVRFAGSSPQTPYSAQNEPLIGLGVWSPRMNRAPTRPLPQQIGRSNCKASRTTSGADVRTAISPSWDSERCGLHGRIQEWVQRRVQEVNPARGSRDGSRDRSRGGHRGVSGEVDLSTQGLVKASSLLRVGELQIPMRKAWLRCP